MFALQGHWLATLGQQGKPFNFQTPPLFQILVAILFRLFGIKDFILPLLSVLFSCITIYLLFHIGKLLYSKQDGIYGVILFISTEFYLFFSRSGLSDATFLCFFTASLFFFIKGIMFNRTNHFLLAGLLTSLALYTKYSAFPLLITFFTLGLLYRKKLNEKWFTLSILLPTVLFSPFVYLFIKFVHMPEISARHVSLLGINHIQFLHYLLILAPMPFLLTLIFIFFNIKIIRKEDVCLFAFIVIFFLILGFYYPYFRLAYPIIPLLSITAARFVKKSGRYRPYLVIASVVLGLALSINTVFYRSSVPERTGQLTDYYAGKENINYIYTVVPPNIDFYINGAILVPSNHLWFTIGEKVPLFLEGKKIMYPENNELLHEGKILLVHATALDSLKRENSELYKRATLLASVEFKDAPVYYKDIYNPQRNIKQSYEIYLFENKRLKEKIDNLWDLGFDRRVTVMIRPE